MRTLLLALLVPAVSGCARDVDRCAAIDPHVAQLQHAALTELPADARAAVLAAQRSVIGELAQRDCALAQAPYSECVLSAGDLDALSACSGGAR
jgi:hypothetical protein